MFTNNHIAHVLMPVSVCFELFTNWCLSFQLKTIFIYTESLQIQICLSLSVSYVYLLILNVGVLFCLMLQLEKLLIHTNIQMQNAQLLDVDSVMMFLFSVCGLGKQSAAFTYIFKFSHTQRVSCIEYWILFNACVCSFWVQKHSASGYCWMYTEHMKCFCQIYFNTLTQTVQYSKCQVLHVCVCLFFNVSCTFADFLRKLYLITSISRIWSNVFNLCVECFCLSITYLHTTHKNISTFLDAFCAWTFLCLDCIPLQVSTTLQLKVVFKPQKKVYT